MKSESTDTDLVRSMMCGVSQRLLAVLKGFGFGWLRLALPKCGGASEAHKESYQRLMSSLSWIWKLENKLQRRLCMANRPVSFLSIGIV